MTMQFISGNIELSNNVFEKEIWQIFRAKIGIDSGILGYKMPALGNRYIEDIPSFVLRSINNGVLIIDVFPDKLVDIVDEGRFWVSNDGNETVSREYTVLTFVRDLQNKLSKSTLLFDYKHDKFKVNDFIKPVLIFPLNSKEEIDLLKHETDSLDINCITKENYQEELIQLISSGLESPLNSTYVDEIDSIIESTSVFNRKRGRKAVTPENKHDLIKMSLVETFKLDSTQRKVALQVPNGPQRIRGLAGTGKTIILSMKAALTHIFNKDFNILFVFNTQSMYKQIIENIEKYTIEEASSAPDWSRLKILHAWGGSKKEGLYSMLCHQYSKIPKTYYDAKRHPDVYQYIYQDLLETAGSQILPQFDMVLIDEAQDFPPAFFETIFKITKTPKRIIWAYDEFQSLNELKINEPSKMFGLGEDLTPNIPDDMLQGEYDGGIEKDFMLPHSYRNPRKVLMYAHGLGLGLYSKNAKVPMQDRISWEARGYKIISPNKNKFDEDDEVKVERPLEYSRNILENLIIEHQKFSSESLIEYSSFSTAREELTSVCERIRSLIEVDSIEPEEIIVISLDKKNAEAHFNFLRSLLLQSGISCITPGFVERTDLFKEKDKVTLTTPFRAKGNEANIVFVINSQKVIDDRSLRDRNGLFVSITRSRGWCFISSNGPKSVELKSEIKELEYNYPFFHFTFPKNSDYLRRVNIISDLDKNLEKVEKDIDAILQNDASIALMLDKAKDSPELILKIKDMLGL